MSQDAINSLLEHCIKRKYRANQTIIRSGQAADHLYVIVEGAVVIKTSDKSRRFDLIAEKLGSGQFFGESALISDEMDHPFSVKAQTDCVIASISIDQLKRLLTGLLQAQSAELLMNIAGQVSARLNRARRKYVDSLEMNVTTRIAALLVDLAKTESISHPDGRQIRITRQEIGQQVGCSRETAGKILKKLAAHNFIHAHGKTVVIYGD